MTKTNDGNEAPSRSARKRALQDLKPLVERTLALNDKALLALGLPEDLLAELQAAKKLKAGSAKSRQMRVLIRMVDELEDFDLAARIDGMHRRPGHNPV